MEHCQTVREMCLTGKVSKKLLSKSNVAKEELGTCALKVETGQGGDGADSETLLHKAKGAHESRVSSKNKHESNQGGSGRPFTQRTQTGQHVPSLRDVNIWSPTFIFRYFPLNTT